MTDTPTEVEPEDRPVLRAVPDTDSGAAEAREGTGPTLEGTVVPADRAERTDPTDEDGESEPARVDRPETQHPEGVADRARQADRRPLVPDWARSRDQLADAAKWVAGHYSHAGAYHALRLPKYGGRVAARAPRGAFRVVAGAIRWATDAEGIPVRLAAVRREDPEQYLNCPANATPASGPAPSSWPPARSPCWWVRWWAGSWRRRCRSGPPWPPWWACWACWGRLRTGPCWTAPWSPPRSPSSPATS